MIEADRLVLLDTSALVVLARGRAEGERLRVRLGLSERPADALVSAISIGEVLALVRKWNWGPKKIERVRELVANLTILGIDRQPILDTYARFSSDLEKAGRRMGQQNDIWIAATAAATGAVLVTLEKDFEDLHPEHLTRLYIDPRDLTEPTDM